LAWWTNDLFRSNPHRAVNRTGRERFLIAAFLNPSYRTEVACLPICASPGNPTLPLTPFGALSTHHQKPRKIPPRNARAQVYARQ
jgi:isopenicillin N synthase-like dioxygenase